MDARYTVNDLAKDVNRKLHSGNVNMCKDFYGSLDEGRRNMTSKIIPPELVRTAYIEQALYDQVDKYAVPSDLKYDSVVDIKMLSSYRNLDRFQVPLIHIYRREFDQKRRDNVFAINWSNGLKTMSIFRPTGLEQCQHLIINEASSLTDNGTWNTGGNLVNLELDKLKYICGHGSLRFDFNNSGTTGFLENFTMTPVDLYDYLKVGAVFTWLSLSVFKIITSVKITLGSNTSDLTTDLYQYTVNSPHDNNEFMTGWNLLKFPLDNLVRVGNPNIRSISYVRFDFTTTGEAMVSCNLDNVVARKGVVYEMDYNTPNCIVDLSTQVWKQKATSISDLLPLEEDTYQILMLETALVVQKEVYSVAGGSVNDINDITDDLKTAYINFKNKHKDEFITPQQTTNRYGAMKYGYYGVNRNYDLNDDNSPYPY